VGEDLHPKGVVPWPNRVKLKKGEVLVSSFIIYRSRAHRDQVNKRMMKDPRMKEMMTESVPFDMKRMVYGGFKTFIHF
jgi:alkaline phosphatase